MGAKVISIPHLSTPLGEGSISPTVSGLWDIHSAYSHPCPLLLPDLVQSFLLIPRNSTCPTINGPLYEFLEPFPCIAAVSCFANWSLDCPSCFLYPRSLLLFVWTPLLPHCNLESAPRQKGRIDVKLPSMHPSCSGSHPCTKYCPVPKNSCFVYFLHF